jgi:hypothetical protein
LITRPFKVSVSSTFASHLNYPSPPPPQVSAALTLAHRWCGNIQCLLVSLIGQGVTMSGKWVMVETPHEHG